MPSYVILVVLIFIKGFLSSPVDNFDINVNDILDERFMPVSLFLSDDKWIGNSSSNTREHFYGEKVKPDGNFTEAFSMMGFHRQKMNEYLCSSFIANQILSEFSTGNISSFQKRSGPVAVKVDEKEKSENSSSHKIQDNLPNKKLLFDQGSEGYKDWLMKTTTLDDIQRQVGRNLKEVPKVQHGKRRPPKNRRNGYEDDDVDEDEGDDDEYEEGDITGYAMQKPLSSDENEESYAGSHLHGSRERYVSAIASNHGKRNGALQHHIGYVYPQPTGYEHTDQEQHNSPEYYPHEISAGSHVPSHVSTYHPGGGHESYGEEYSPQHVEYGMEDTKKSKELKLKDFMDIALTTLAFLSFGMFVLQVLMCITLNKQDTSTPTMMMMPMDVDGGGANGSTEEVRRRKRSDDNRQLKKVNEMSRRVLQSIEAVLLAAKDQGDCVHRVLCRHNKYARVQKDGQKYWIPIWGLGISWLVAKYSPPTVSATATLNSLKAAAIGLGGGDCDKLYSSCDFKPLLVEREESRRSRRDLRFEWSL